MTTEGFKRKLIAILGADFKAYSCLIREVAIGEKELGMWHNPA